VVIFTYFEVYPAEAIFRSVIQDSTEQEMTGANGAKFRSYNKQVSATMLTNE
jgi:hypothetical protein